MRVPKDSLDDFSVIPTPEPVDPPTVKIVLPSGTFEVLKPLTRAEIAARRQARPAGSTYVGPELFPGPRQEFSWFIRSVGVGGGFLVIIAFILASSIFIGIYDPPEIERAESATPQLRSPLLAQNEIAPLYFLSSEDFAPVSDELRLLPMRIRTRPTRPRVILAVYTAPRVAPRRERVLTEFVPTKLVIYPENGVIKTRIEPQLTAAYIKQPTLPLEPLP